MTIAHVVMSLGAGGQERVVLHLTNAAVAAGHRVHVVALSPPSSGDLTEELARAGAEIHRAPKRDGGLDPILTARLTRIFSRARVDIVHSHNPLPLVYAPLAARLARAGVIHTKHGANPSGTGNLLLRRAATALVDYFVAVSPKTADQARRRNECAARKLVVIANGIPLDRFVPSASARASTRAALGIPDDAFVIGAVGRVDENKNHPYLVRAAMPLLGPRVRLLVVGDGAAMPALRAAAEARGAATSAFIHLPGWSSDVPGALAAMDVLAMSSRSEGLPLVIPEAMSCGLPVVSTAVGGIPDVIEEGVTGFLVPATGEDESALRSPLASLARDPARARAMGQRARAEAHARYGAERMATSYADLYRRARGRRR